MPMHEMAPPLTNQRGAALVVVMLVLLVVTVTGVASARVALLGEQTARHDRDMQIAFEAAEAAVVDAEDDIRNRGSAGCAALRGHTKFLQPDPSGIPAGTCLATAGDRGICAPAPDQAARPAWAAVDFGADGAGAASARFGEFTCRTFDAGAGVKPARPPRYVIELIQDSTPGQSASAPRFMYRITAMGFGPRDDTRAVVQVEFRKEME
jgi:type IV pilus assembly protein PilX